MATHKFLCVGWLGDSTMGLYGAIKSPTNAERCCSAMLTSAQPAWEFATVDAMWAVRELCAGAGCAQACIATQQLCGFGGWLNVPWTSMAHSIIHQIHKDAAVLSTPVRSQHGNFRVLMPSRARLVDPGLAITAF
jgi:hypothetical protein